jgi:peptidoglycan/LPS O-acetylase OafA/YrhL
MEERAEGRAPRFVGIEGMRAIAACSILIFHCSQLYATDSRPVFGQLASLLRPFWLGVTAFFVLSGFLLYRPFAAAIIDGRPLPSIRRYLRHRVFRILPAYWVILTVSGFVLGATFVDASPAVTGFMSGHLGLFALDALLVQEYHPATIGTGIMPAWSLSAEAAFYVLLPVLVVLASRAALRSAGHRYRLAVSLAPVAVLELLGVTGHVLDTWVFPGPVGSFANGWHSVIDRGFLGQADGFAWGMAVAVIWCEMRSGRMQPLSRATRMSVETALVVAALGTLIYAPEVTSLMFPAPFAVILGFVALNQHQAERSRVIRVLNSKPLVAAGLASYSVFLWNVPVFLLMCRYGLVVQGYAGFPVTLALLMLLTGICSFVTYRYVEAPAIRRARRRRVSIPMMQAPLEAPAPSVSGP